MVQNAPISPVYPISSSKKPEIDLHAALQSSLRAWLASRDSALFLFCSGIAVQRLELMDLEPLGPIVARMNILRSVCMDFASQIASLSPLDGTAEGVMSGAIDTLLSLESPKFLLHSESLPGSF